MSPKARTSGLLLVHAHPDDECFATGGLIARSIAEGRRVDLVVCTGGEEGEVHDPALDGFLNALVAEFRTLPFAERWAYRLDSRAPALLNQLVRRRVAMTYPALLDVGGGIVSQAEHTMIVGAAGADVTTA